MSSQSLKRSTLRFQPSHVLWFEKKPRQCLLRRFLKQVARFQAHLWLEISEKMATRDSVLQLTSCYGFKPWTGGLSQPLEIKITSSRQALWAVFQHWPLDLWMQRFIFADDPPLIISIAMASVFNFCVPGRAKLQSQHLAQGGCLTWGNFAVACFVSHQRWVECITRMKFAF